MPGARARNLSPHNTRQILIPPKEKTGSERTSLSLLESSPASLVIVRGASTWNPGVLPKTYVAYVVSVIVIRLIMGPES